MTFEEKISASRMISVCTRMPLHHIRCKLGLLVELASIFIETSSVFFHGVHYIWKGVGLFFDQVSYCINVFFIHFGSGGPGRLEGETSPEAINLLITLEKA